MRIYFARLPKLSALKEKPLMLEDRLSCEKLSSETFRLPFFEDADPSEAATALNHVYAGTMARTLSQVPSYLLRPGISGVTRFIL